MLPWDRHFVKLCERHSGVSDASTPLGKPQTAQGTHTQSSFAGLCILVVLVKTGNGNILYSSFPPSFIFSVIPDIVYWESIILVIPDMCYQKSMLAFLDGYLPTACGYDEPDGYLPLPMTANGKVGRLKDKREGSGFP